MHEWHEYILRWLFFGEWSLIFEFLMMQRFEDARMRWYKMQNVSIRVF